MTLYSLQNWLIFNFDEYYCNFEINDNNTKKDTLEINSNQVYETLPKIITMEQN